MVPALSSPWGVGRRAYLSKWLHAPRLSYRLSYLYTGRRQRQQHRKSHAAVVVSFSTHALPPSSGTIRSTTASPSPVPLLPESAQSLYRQGQWIRP